MNKLIGLELKRNSLKPYHISAVITTVITLGLLYLFAAIPKMGSADADAAIFMSYNFILGLSNVVCMLVFSIMSSVMASKFIVDEYTGKKVILLFSYPIEREKVLNAKILTVFIYTLYSMFVSCCFALTVFFITESLFPLCPDAIHIELVLSSLLSSLCYSLIAAFVGIVSLWFGFIKKSVPVTIVASCIITTLICQLMGMSLFYRPIIVGALGVVFVFAVLAWTNLKHQVERIEV